MLKKSILVFAVTLLVGCGTRVDFRETQPIPAFLITDGATISESNGAWQLRGGDTSSSFTPMQAPIAVATNAYGGAECADKSVHGLTLGLTALLCIGAITNVFETTDWINYHNILKIGTYKEMPHYDVIIQAQGKQLFGKLLFNTILNDAPTAVKRVFPIDLYAGSRVLPKIGDIAVAYGKYIYHKDQGTFATWMLWFSDTPL